MMKYLKILNFIATLIPLGVFLYISQKEHSVGSGIIVGLMSTSITGGIQLMLSLIYFYKYPKETLIKIYFAGVILFFSIWYFKPNNDWYWGIPPVLFIFLSYIIYFKRTASIQKPK